MFFLTVMEIFAAGIEVSSFGGGHVKRLLHYASRQGAAGGNTAAGRYDLR
jgi:hypothetical protein